MMYQQCGSLLTGSLCNLHASGCLQLSAVPRPCRRPLRLRVHAGDDAPALASKPTLRAPPKKPAPPPKPQLVGFRTRLEREKQAAERHAADGQSKDQRSQGPSGNQQGGDDKKPSRDQQQRDGGGSRPQPFQQRGPSPQNGSGPARPSIGDRPKWTPAKLGGNAGAPPGQVQGFYRRGSGGRGKSDWTQDGSRGSRPRAQFDRRQIDIKSRRETRGTRRRDRAIAREAAAPVRRDIFEVSEDGMPVEDLASMLAVDPSEVVKTLFMKGIMVQVNQVLDRDTVHMVVEDYEDVEIMDKEHGGVEEGARKSTAWIDDEDMDFLVPRPPVVTIMGHVDHGKTSLLDFVRKTKVAAGEAGGITQAIGAYTVDVPHDGENSRITFVDTPGHEAFSAMRARGTKVTDIAVIVVAADDGVRPQTQEAISHAKAAEVPIVIAINKVDKPGAQPERVKQELADIGILPEEWGGEVSMVSISAKHGQGVDDLLEQILLQAEVAELMTNPQRSARGTVIEAHLDRRRGPVASLLVQAGTLRIGDMIVASASYGKVKTLAESTGEVDEATPSLAVQMAGLNSVPTAGDEFYVCVDETEARKAAEIAEDTQRMDRLAASAGGGNIVTTKSWASMDDDSEALQRLNVILKTDASGTLEAVKAALSTLPQDSVMLRFLLATPNQITISDVDLAMASEAMVLGFNTEPSEEVQAAAKEKGVLLRSYNIIYDLVDDIRAAMEGRLVTVEERTELGQAEVRATFGSGTRVVAGCMVNEGMLRKDAFLVVRRGRKTVFEGQLTSLRRGKDDVKEVGRGLECGLRVDGFTAWREGDNVDAFLVADKRRTLEEAALSEKPGRVSMDELDEE